MIVTTFRPRGKPLTLTGALETLHVWEDKHTGAPEGADLQFRDQVTGRLIEVHLDPVTIARLLAKSQK